jgi:Tfp pilus assembly protein PilF
MTLSRFAAAVPLSSLLALGWSLAAAEPPAASKPYRAADAPPADVRPGPAPADLPAKPLAADAERPADAKPAGGPAAVAAGRPMRTFPAKLPLSGLPPAKIVLDLCLVRYRVSTNSPECQAFFDQGLGYFYSYVWMEAARSFETAAQYDPDCAMAWWGLSRSLEKWAKGDATKALLKAGELRDKAGDRERRLILASLQEKGHVPGVGDADARKAAAVATLDEMLAIDDDDEEAWYFRAQLSGGAKLFGGDTSAVPFYKALLRVNPLHPGANHELVHYYENCSRPALGWKYAEKYIESSPGIPHAFHMQAHLATRLGRWAKTADRSAHAVELERAYHQDMKVSPGEDHQYSHHLEILMVSLTHDGQFAQGRAVEAEVAAANFKLPQAVFRLHFAERDWAAALAAVDRLRRSDRSQASYFAALVYLKTGDADRAAREVESLRHGYHERRGDAAAEYRLWEAQGLLLCAQGSADEGLKLLAKAAERSKGDYGHHAWGNGAYFMETWGTAALAAGRDAEAEEAFQEGLAHDPASVRSALGLEFLCERQGRSEEAARYADLARRCWARADDGRLETERAALREGSGSAPPLMPPAK